MPPGDVEMGKQNGRGRSEAKVCKVSVSASSCQALWIVVIFEVRPTLDKGDGFSYTQATPVPSLPPPPPPRRGKVLSTPVFLQVWLWLW